jgi:hypothetical protein
VIDERQLITELELEIGETYNCDIGYGLKRAIEIVEHRPLVGEWIPCSERLPELYKPVLVTYEGRLDGFGFKKIVIANMEPDCEWKVMFGGYCDKERIIAWKPLPEPYKEEVNQ